MKTRILHIAKFIALSFLFSWFATSCTEKIDIDLEETYTRLVVDGQITTDTTSHFVKLTKTADYFSNKPAEPVTGASVSINSYILQESDSVPGLYLTEPNVYGIIGETYTLTIDNVDIDNNGENEFYTASSKIKTIAEGDSIDVVYREITDEVQFWEIQLYAQDPPEDNYYLFKVYINDTLVTDTVDEYVTQDDQLFNGNYVPGAFVQSLSPDKPDEVLEKGDVVTLEANGITQDYYKFIIELNSETGGSNPLFNGPPANVRSNIEGGNGAVGYFSAYSVRRLSKTITNVYKKP